MVHPTSDDNTPNIMEAVNNLKLLFYLTPGFKNSNWRSEPNLYELFPYFIRLVSEFLGGMKKL